MPGPMRACARRCCRPASRPRRRSRPRHTNVSSEGSLSIFFILFVLIFFYVVELFGLVGRVLHFISTAADTIVAIHPFVTRFVRALPAHVFVAHDTPFA